MRTVWANDGADFGDPDVMVTDLSFPSNRAGDE